MQRQKLLMKPLKDCPKLWQFSSKSFGSDVGCLQQGGGGQRLSNQILLNVKESFLV